MTICDFIKEFRLGVKDKNEGRSLTVSTLSAITGVKADTLRNCEGKGYIPRSDVDRTLLKNYFKIDNLVDIPSERLIQAIEEFNIDDMNYKLWIDKEKSDNKKKDKLNKNKNHDSYQKIKSTDEPTITNVIKKLNRIIYLLEHSSSKNISDK